MNISLLRLKEILQVGPTIQQDLFVIIARFRQHQHVITVDITKMYQQVKLRADQRNLQRILWRSESNQPTRIYRLNIYGMASALFLAIRCLHEIAHQYAQEVPIISNIIQNDYYVDNLLRGGDTIDQVKLKSRKKSSEY